MVGVKNILPLLALPFARVAAQTAVSSSVFNNILRYTQFSAAAYQDDCGSPPFGSTIVKTFSVNATDAQATLFRDDSAQEVIIAFRGTSTPQDLDTDLAFGLVPVNTKGISCSSCNVHNGFQNAFGSLNSAVTSAIKSQLSSNSGYKFIVTGHSLGAGLAAIATPSFIGQGLTVAVTYTFGEPRNGDAAWASFFTSKVPNSKYFRVTHSNDGVPQIPPVSLGYAHHSNEYYQSQPNSNSASTTFKCSVDSSACIAGNDYGSSPINAAHITYSNGVIGSSLFNTACGAAYP